MADKTSAIPNSTGQVQKQFLNKDFLPKGSVEEARAAMLAAKEPVRTIRGVPSFIKKATPDRGEGGNTPVESIPAAAPIVVRTPQTEAPEPTNNGLIRDARTVHALKYNAYQKMRSAGLRTGESVDLVQLVRDGILTKDEAEVLLGAPITIEEELEETTEPEVAVIPSATPVEHERVAAVPPEPEIEVFEDPNFTIRRFRDGKLWVGEITYKNGAGTERFTGASKDELMTALLRGKANATLKVRETSEKYKKQVREAALGKNPDTWDYFFDILHETHGLTVEQYNALPETSREAVIDSLRTVEATKFLNEYPEYYPTEANFKAMGEFLNKEKWPLTYRNLQLAYFHLSEMGLLETKPVEQVVAPAAPEPAAPAPVVSVQPAATPVEDSTAAATPAVSPSATAPAPAAAPARKRGTTGLIPGSSSAAPTAPRTEDRNRPQEPSEKELRTMPMADLKRIATQGRKYSRY
jgi:hypothetical protein